MIKRLGVALSGLLLVAAAPASATVLPPGFGETTLVGDGLSAPTAIDWAPDGRMFVAEKAGRVRVVTADGTLLKSPLLDIADKVNSPSDRGLLGLAVDKDFASNGYLYLLYVFELNPLEPDSEAPMVSRLTRVTVNPDNTLENPADPETVVLGTQSERACPRPDNTVDCIPADFIWHVIGTVRSDPVDGTLWLGTGDSHSPTPIDELTYRPYDEHTFAGKLIHIDRNGHGLPNHPFCPDDVDLTHVCTKLYAKGFRNPFRFTLRPGKGPVVGDVGFNDQEEIDLVSAGENYGWPCYEGSIRTPLYRTEPRCQQEYAKEGTSDAVAPPAWSYARGEGAAVVAGPTYEGPNYPSGYAGKIFVGDYVQGWVKLLTINSGDQVIAVEDFASGWPGGVDLKLMPNGDLAFADIGFGSTSSVGRFTYAEGNLPPTPVASASPDSGDPPLTVQFSGSDSTDPEDDPLTYEWDFGDGSARSSEANPSHTYTDPGTFQARLTVDDGHQRNPNVAVTVQVGPNLSPTAEILAPAEESLYRNGEAVELAGRGDDAEDGSLAGAALSWNVLLHHGTHLHQVTSFEGVGGQFTPYVDHDADSYYEIILTATDSGGLTAEHRVRIRPKVIHLTLDSIPPGAPVRYSGEGPFSAPLTRTAAVGLRAIIEADPALVSNGRTYNFSHWSDGAPGKHLITVPAQDTTLTAVYESDAERDAAAPGLMLGFNARQKRIDTVMVRVTSDEDATVNARGTIKVPLVRNGGSATANPKSAESELKGQSSVLAAGETRTVKLRLRPKAIGLIRRAQSEGLQAKAEVSVSAVDAAGNEVATTRAARLKRPAAARASVSRLFTVFGRFR